MNRQLSLNAGIFLLTTVFLTYLFSALLFWAGGEMNGYVFPCAVAVSAVAMRFAMRRDRHWLGIVGCSVAFIAVMAVVCAYLPDNSYDGNFYHQEGVIGIYRGWNPYHETYPGESLWVRHYAKMLEIASAAVMSVTGNIESGKLVNVMLAVSSLLILSGTLAKMFTGMGRRRRWLVAVLFAVNPVVVAQTLTFYNDYALYCCLVILVAMFTYIYKGLDGKITWMVATMATMIAIGTKFTHFFYIGLAWIMFIALLLAVKRYSVAGKCVLAGMVSLVIGGVFLGWHPYVTNWVNFGHPLYPLMGQNYDIMTQNTPDMYVGDGRFVNFFKSMMSSEKSGEWSCPLIPLHPADITSLGYDCRVNGFGPFFGLMLLTGLAILAARCRDRVLWYMVGCLLVSCFIFEQSWWARYIPFLWAVPALAVLHMSLPGAALPRPAVYLRRLIMLCGLGSAAIALMISLYTKVETHVWRELLRETVADKPVRVDFAGAESFRYKLDAAGIDYIETERRLLDVSHTVLLYGTDYYDAMPVMELSAEDYDRIMSPGWKTRVFRIRSRGIAQ